MKQIVGYCILFMLVGGTSRLGNAIKPKKYHNCKLYDSQPTFDVLPGVGWDNLANLEMGRILDLNFSKCVLSNDNRYLIPNLLTLRPVKTSMVYVFSETFEHYINYTSINSKSVNIGAYEGFSEFGLGGAFSNENYRVKKNQLETKTIFTRVQLRYKVYESYFEPDVPLFPNFKNRIMDITASVTENKDSLYPSYLADMVIRDYGTHVIRSTDAGAILSKTDNLDSQYVKNYKSGSSIISASASGSFFKYFGLESKFQSKVSNEKIDNYNKKCSKTHIDSMGGTIIRANFSLNKWQDSVLSNLVPIDRRGDPIYSVITPQALPELDHQTVNKVYSLLKEAVKRYYSKNAKRGCLNFLSPNFNPDANIDSGNCKSPQVNFTLGGTYQTCSGPTDQCSDVTQVNPLTNGYSCPISFTSNRLLSSLNRCVDHYYRYWIFWTRSYKVCSYFATYWCSPNAIGLNHNGYQFGGFRPVSKPDCPLGYIPLKLGLNVVMCVTTSSDPFNLNAIKLGGLYSCNVGNPLARYTFTNQRISFNDPQSLPKSCAKGYVSNVASVERGCQISYCTKIKKLSLGSLHRPPFIELKFNPNSTNITIFKAYNGNIFIKDKDGTWNLRKLESQNQKSLIGSIFGCILIMSFICLVVVLIQRRFYMKKLRAREISELLNENDRNNYGVINYEYA